MTTKDFSLRPANSPCSPTPVDEFEYASEITNAFEGGKADSLQTLDSGIVSYGKHQATLASGTLESVINSYIAESDSDTSVAIEKFLPRIQLREESLRTDETFLSLLTTAAQEEAMSNAQEGVFSENFWEPAKKLAEKIGICSPLGKAIFYDTKIQGGLNTVLSRTIDALPESQQTERGFLALFLDKRRDYLESIADKKRKAGDEATAKLLENSAAYRISALETKLAESHDSPDSTSNN